MTDARDLAATTAGATAQPLMSVRGLGIRFKTAQGVWQATRKIDFDIAPGERVGIVGESGCGKTITGLSILRLLPNNLSGLDGSIMFDDVDLASCSTSDHARRYAARRIAMIFQEPMSALDPVFTVGHQIAETLRVHTDVSKEEARAQTIDMLRRVGIASPERRIDEYPHQLSGGMRQRVMIAAALICGPQLLIADEPTTALDVTVQAQILDLLRDLSETSKTALMLITHDLGVVAETCTRMITMYAGEVIEDAAGRRRAGPAAASLYVRPVALAAASEPAPRQAALDPGPGSLDRRDAERLPLQGALSACDRRAAKPSRNCSTPARAARSAAGASRSSNCPAPCSTQPQRRSREGWSGNDARRPATARRTPSSRCGTSRCGFQTMDRRATVKAVDGVNFDVRRGETFGIIGESGSGKTTIGRALVFLLKPTAGAILHNGVDPQALPRKQFQSHRRDYQIIFQDPECGAEPAHDDHLLGAGAARARARGNQGRAPGAGAARRWTASACRQELGERYPHQLSGGQKQRVIIARALTLRPKLIVCDEVVAALDMSIRGDVLNLFAELQRDLGLTYVFITHDLSVVSHISDRIAVMYLGRFVELGPTESVSERPLHPYTQALLSAEPLPLPSTMRSDRRIILQGEMPSPIDPPSGCRFRTRCQYAQAALRRADARTGANLSPITGSPAISPTARIFRRADHQSRSRRTMP